MRGEWLRAIRPVESAAGLDTPPAPTQTKLDQIDRLRVTALVKWTNVLTIAIVLAVAVFARLTSSAVLDLATIGEINGAVKTLTPAAESGPTSDFREAMNIAVYDAVEKNSVYRVSFNLVLDAIIIVSMLWFLWPGRRVDTRQSPDSRQTHAVEQRSPGTMATAD